MDIFSAEIDLSNYDGEDLETHWILYTEDYRVRIGALTLVGTYAEFVRLIEAVHRAVLEEDKRVGSIARAEKHSTLGKPMYATFVRRLVGWTWDARLYKVDPPVIYTTSDGEPLTTDHIIVSAIPLGGVHETLAFPATPEGEPINMLDLPGSMRGTLDHDLVLQRMGYNLPTSEES